MTAAVVALSKHIDTMTRDEVVAELGTVAEVCSQAMTMTARAACHDLAAGSRGQAELPA